MHDELSPQAPLGPAASQAEASELLMPSPSSFRIRWPARRQAKYASRNPATHWQTNPVGRDQ
eukprot:scaffold457860_cov34-Prasinocladus_malaysianus.AAC.1